MHVAVIGGGLMGMTLAYFLSEGGHQVTVLEQDVKIGGLHSVVDM
ncbi:MAG: FAD-dependent oxidoreductase, partial [Anaerolineae bacterium]|nr:FAD-dependent oxidoreductase [Anaerolineae bacterium]